MTVFWPSRNLHIISLSIFLSNTTALAEIGCLHQRLWRYNLVIIFLFRFINFCFLVYVIDSHSSWRVWQRPTTITRGYTYSRRFDQRLDSISTFGNLLNYPSIFCQFLTMFSPCLFFFPVRAYSIWCIVDRKYTSFLSRYRSIITLPLLLKDLSHAWDFRYANFEAAWFGPSLLYHKVLFLCFPNVERAWG